MAIELGPTGTVENNDLVELVIERGSSGALAGRVVYKVEVLGSTQLKEAKWTLSTSEKTAVTSSLLTGAKAAIANDLGL